VRVEQGGVGLGVVIIIFLFLLLFKSTRPLPL
jgi:hypothetical protein